MMPSLSGIGWTVFCLLMLWRTLAGNNVRIQLDLHTFFSFFKWWLCCWRIKCYMPLILAAMSERSLTELSEWKWKLLVYIVLWEKSDFFWEAFQLPQAEIEVLTSLITHSIVSLTSRNADFFIPPCANILGLICFTLYNHVSTLTPQLKVESCNALWHQWGRYTLFRVCWRGLRLVLAVLQEKVATRRLTSLLWEELRTAPITRWRFKKFQVSNMIDTEKKTTEWWVSQSSHFMII